MLLSDFMDDMVFKNVVELVFCIKDVRLWFVDLGFFLFFLDNDIFLYSERFLWNWSNIYIFDSLNEDLDLVKKLFLD